MKQHVDALSPAACRCLVPPRQLLQQQLGLSYVAFATKSSLIPAFTLSARRRPRGAQA